MMIGPGAGPENVPNYIKTVPLNTSIVKLSSL